MAVPGDGPVSWTAREDEAEAAALLLAADDVPDGPVTLTAPEAPTFAELAEVASDLVGSTVTHRVVDEDAWVAAEAAAGRPEPMTRFVLGFYRAAAGGFFAGTDPTLPRLLGRAPRTTREVLAATASGAAA